MPPQLSNPAVRCHCVDKHHAIFHESNARNVRDCDCLQLLSTEEFTGGGGIAEEGGSIPGQPGGEMQEPEQASESGGGGPLTSGTSDGFRGGAVIVSLGSPALSKDD